MQWRPGKEKKMEIEVQRLALETQEQNNKKVVDKRAIMFMYPRKMGERARQYWELTHGDILAKSFGGGGDNGGDNNGDGGGNVDSNSDGGNGGADGDDAST